MYKVKILLVAFCILLGVSVELFTTVISRNRTIEDLNEKLIQKAKCDSNARLLTQYQNTLLFFIEKKPSIADTFMTVMENYDIK